MHFTLFQGQTGKRHNITAILSLPPVYIAFNTGHQPGKSSINPAMCFPLIKELFVVKGEKEQVREWPLSQLTLRATTQVSTSELVV